jgi:hypothetical protein
MSGVRNVLPPLNFLTLHYLYFVVMGLIWSLIVWGSSQPPQSVGYTDSLFLSVSAMTGTGLNTVRVLRTLLCYMTYLTFTCRSTCLLSTRFSKQFFSD